MNILYAIISLILGFFLGHRLMHATPTKRPIMATLVHGLFMFIAWFFSPVIFGCYISAIALALVTAWA